MFKPIEANRRSDVTKSVPQGRDVSDDADAGRDLERRAGEAATERRGDAPSVTFFCSVTGETFSSIPLMGAAGDSFSLGSVPCFGRLPNRLGDEELSTELVGSTCEAGRIGDSGEEEASSFSDSRSASDFAPGDLGIGCNFVVSLRSMGNDPPRGSASEGPAGGGSNAPP